LAAFALESDFNQAKIELLLQKYFSTKKLAKKSTIKDKVIKLLLFQVCQDFLWSIWICIKEAKSDDFGTYGSDRYLRSKQKLAELEAILKQENLI